MASVLPDTRRRIVHAAMRLFAEKGYNSTSVADILGAAGVNAGSLYHAFPGKQDVLLAVLDEYQAGIGPMLLEPAWGHVADPIERVFALLASYRRRLVDTECLYGCPIGSVALELHEPDPAVRGRLAANFDGWVDAVERCFVAAGDRLPAELDRRALAVHTLTTMEGGVMLSRTHRTLDAFDAAVAMLRAWLDALQQTAASAPQRSKRGARSPSGASTKRQSTKRQSTKRRSTKRQSTKRESTKRESTKTSRSRVVEHVRKRPR